MVMVMVMAVMRWRVVVVEVVMVVEVVVVVEVVGGPPRS